MSSIRRPAAAAGRRKPPDVQRPGKPGTGFTRARRSDLLGSTSTPRITQTGPDWQRSATIARVHELLAAAAATDPTVSGATLILPDGETVYLLRPAVERSQ